MTAALISEQATTYSQGERWAIKFNHITSDNGRLPYWIASHGNNEDRARKLFNEELKDAKRRYPDQPDMWPEILKTETVWTVQEPT